jgi:hypothetical protein
MLCGQLPVACVCGSHAQRTALNTTPTHPEHLLLFLLLLLLLSAVRESEIFEKGDTRKAATLASKTGLGLGE